MITQHKVHSNCKMFLIIDFNKYLDKDISSFTLQQKVISFSNTHTYQPEILDAVTKLAIRGKTNGTGMPCIILEEWDQGGTTKDFEASFLH